MVSFLFHIAWWQFVNVKFHKYLINVNANAYVKPFEELMAALNTDDVRTKWLVREGPTVKSTVSSHIATLSWNEISKSVMKTNSIIACQGRLIVFKWFFIILVVPNHTCLNFHEKHWCDHELNNSAQNDKFSSTTKFSSLLY